jgi:hypothetical protein
MVLKQGDGKYAIDLIEMKQERNEAMHLYSSCIVTCARATRKVSSHFEYLKNRSRLACMRAVDWADALS